METVLTYILLGFVVGWIAFDIFSLIIELIQKFINKAFKQRKQK